MKMPLAAAAAALALGPGAALASHGGLARQVEAPQMVMPLDRLDLIDDRELLDLVELELRELLQRSFAPADPKKGIDPSKLALSPLLDLAPAQKGPAERPFLMPVEDVFSISGRGTVSAGRVERLGDPDHRRIRRSADAAGSQRR